MNDLTSRINQILSDPQSMQMIQNMAQSLGLNPPQEQAAVVPPTPAEQPNFDLNQLGSLLSQLGLGQNNPSPAPSLPSIDMNSILQIQKAMQLFVSGNKNVELLRSLRPLLSEKRQKKVDDAVRIMQLIQMLPMLKESGLFGTGGVFR